MQTREACEAQATRSAKGSARDFRETVLYGIAPLLHTYFTQALDEDRAVKFAGAKHEVLASLLHSRRRGCSNGSLHGPLTALLILAALLTALSCAGAGQPAAPPEEALL